MTVLDSTAHRTQDHPQPRHIDLTAPAPSADELRQAMQHEAGRRELLAEYRRQATQRPEHIPTYPARTAKDLSPVAGYIGHRVIQEQPTPWPGHYDPPTFPHEPGQHPEALRTQWRAWMQAWEAIADPLLGVEPDHESVGELFARMSHLIQLGVRFDPAFRRAMATWAWSGYQVDSDWDSSCDAEGGAV